MAVIMTTPGWNLQLAAVLLIGCSAPPTLEELRHYAATETFPEDTYLDTVSVKRALVIVAHDDDDCAMSGTIHGLSRKGWEIEQLNFQTTPLADGAATHPSSLICKGYHQILAEGAFRGGDPGDTLPAYLPIPKERFGSVFHSAMVKDTLVPLINAFAPAVIFTLDNEIGAYGNPEHVFISQLVLDLFNSGSIHAQRIYQPVYTDHMERTIIGERLSAILKEHDFSNTYAIAKEVYGVEGMPVPDVQVDIRTDSLGKMAYLMAYSEKAKNSLRKFVPYFEEFPAGQYFSVFDREFFRVIERDTTSR